MASNSGKQFYVLITFVALTAIIAAVIGSGALSSIYNTNRQVENQTEKIDIANQQINETNLLLNQKILQTETQKHEDIARANQSRYEEMGRDKQEQHEDAARDKQVVNLTTHIDTQLDNVQDNFSKFINASQQRGGKILDKLNIALENQQSQLSFQDTQLRLLKGQQDAINNITKETLDVLNKFSKGGKQLGIDNRELLENLTRNVEEIRMLVSNMNILSP